jgi:hypothetical protein
LVTPATALSKSTADALNIDRATTGTESRKKVL